MLNENPAWVDPDAYDDDYVEEPVVEGDGSVILIGGFCTIVIVGVFVGTLCCQRKKLHKTKPIAQPGACMSSIADVAELAANINKAETEDDMHDIAARIRKRVIDLMSNAQGPRMAAVVRQHTKMAPNSHNNKPTIVRERMTNAKMDRIAQLYSTMDRVPPARREMYQRKIDELEEDVLSTATF